MMHVLQNGFLTDTFRFWPHASIGNGAFVPTDIECFAISAIDLDKQPPWNPDEFIDPIPFEEITVRPHMKCWGKGL